LVRRGTRKDSQSDQGKRKETQHLQSFEMLLVHCQRVMKVTNYFGPLHTPNAERLKSHLTLRLHEHVLYIYIFGTSRLIIPASAHLEIKKFPISSTVANPFRRALFHVCPGGGIRASNVHIITGNVLDGFPRSRTRAM
jgi:hypothetical protein